MKIDKYQQLAARTIGCKNKFEMLMHSLHGMVGEVGELHSLYQKEYQGHSIDQKHCLKEVGDLLWFIAEYCTACGVPMSLVAEMNIDKLKARYPNGFEEERSLHRAEGDI